MAPPDPLTQMNTYRSYVTMLADPGSKDELKLKAAQELSENFEVIITTVFSDCCGVVFDLLSLRMLFNFR